MDQDTIGTLLINATSKYKSILQASFQGGAFPARDCDDECGTKWHETKSKTETKLQFMKLNDKVTY